MFLFFLVSLLLLLYPTYFFGAPIFAKYNVLGNAAADIIAAVYRECDVDLEEVIVSPATAKRSKVDETIMIKDKVVNEFKQKVLNNKIKLTLHYDTKLMKQRMDGVRSQLERLALVVSAPELERPQLLAVLGHPSLEGPGSPIVG